MEALIETDGTVVMDSTTWQVRVYCRVSLQPAPEMRSPLWKTTPGEYRAGRRRGTCKRGTATQVIPAENLVAAFSSDNAHATLLATVTSSDSAETMLGALEVGTDGVVLRTESPEEARRLAKVMQERHAATRPTFELHTAVVTRVEAAGVGDRVCVDTCSVLHPGEGLLVGSFARTMFLVHSECAESAYVASRPFRINAGPVHSYLVGGGGKTRYLSELCTGEQVR
jgi:3-dehydroquinate synthase class II